MSGLKNNLDLFSKSIFHWLNYENSVCKTNLLVELSVRFPLAEYIERKLKSNVELEFKHPYYAQYNLSKKIDFKIGNGPFDYIELKYLGQSTADKSERFRYLADLIRLAYVSEGNDEAYFLLCGGKNEYLNNFRYTIDEVNEKIPEEGVNDRKVKHKVYSKWFATEKINESKSFVPAEFQEFFKDYNDNYKEALPTFKIVTKLVGREYQEDCGVVVFIWLVTKEQVQYREWSVDELNQIRSLNLNNAKSTIDKKLSKLCKDQNRKKWEIVIKLRELGKDVVKLVSE